MFRACILGDLDDVKRLVGRDPSLARAHYEYRTPLSFAVRANHLDVAEYLLDHGALESGLGDPVEMARDRGHTEMVELLERKMGEIYGASATGEPVAAAIRERDLAGVRRLLDENPALLRARDRRSNEPIHWAVMTRQTDVIDELVRRGADPNARRADGALPIHLTNGDYHYRGWRDVPPEVTTTPEDVYRHLVALGADVDLNLAAFTGDEARVRELLAGDPSLANRPSPYTSYYVGSGAPLKDAAVGGHLEIVRLLLEHGADPNLPEEGIAPEGHALYSAVYHGRYDIARLLLEHGAYPNPPVESSADAVWIAIRRGDGPMLELLGAHGAEMGIPIPLEGELSYEDLVASGVRLPLEILAYYGDAPAIAHLLEEHPERAHDAEALSWPSCSSQHGMDPNRPDWLRATPLHHFAARGDIGSAAVFLDHGADLTARDEENESTPLAWAAREGRTRMVEFLLRRGARPELPDDPSWATPLAWATRRGHEEIVQVLTAFQRSGTFPTRSLAELEALVGDLVDAYAGDEPAMLRVMHHFRLERSLGWDRPSLDVRLARFGKAVGEEVGKVPGAATPQEELALTDARLLIARSEGFATWPDLVRAYAGTFE